MARPASSPAILDTPLVPRFVGEGRKLLVAAPVVYLGLIRTTLIIGACALGFGFLATSASWETPFFPSQFWAFLGLLILIAAWLAVLSLDFIDIDLKEKVFKRRSRLVNGWKLLRGSVADFDAVVLVAQPLQLRGVVLYKIVLHWKAAKQPPMILWNYYHGGPMLNPMDERLGPAKALALKISQALGVPFYDNSHFPQP